MRKALPAKYEYIIDELLNCNYRNINKENYYNKIIETIINLGCADDFIEEIAGVIRKLSIDHLHIVGDIFDRGPRPDIALDTLLEIKNIDIQWGNHDVVWMGAMMGSYVCISVVLANSLKYENTIFLEEGYGISLRQLEHFANRHYSGKNSVEKMYRAISVIRFKLEDSLMKSRTEFSMCGKTRLDKINFKEKTWNGHNINTDEFPTVNENEPFKLTDDEKEIMEGLRHSFTNSEKMKKHLNFMFSKGSVYLCHNGIRPDFIGIAESVCGDTAAEVYIALAVFVVGNAALTSCYLKRKAGVSLRNICIVKLFYVHGLASYEHGTHTVVGEELHKGTVGNSSVHNEYLLNAAADSLYAALYLGYHTV